jgi:ABC-type uncharacterized transport system permease subunit
MDAAAAAFALLEPGFARAGALLTVGLATLLFVLLGRDPVQGLQVFFWEPVKSGYAWGELLLKATPLLLIGLGLSLCFRSNVWNIGAEGQFIFGAVTCRHGGACMADADSSRWIVLLVLLAGTAGGMAWGGGGGLVARSLSCQRNSGEPDAGVRGRAISGLYGQRPAEGPRKATAFR